MRFFGKEGLSFGCMEMSGGKDFGQRTGTAITRVGKVTCSEWVPLAGEGRGTGGTHRPDSTFFPSGAAGHPSFRSCWCPSGFTGTGAGVQMGALMLLGAPGLICSHGLSALLGGSQVLPGWFKPLGSIFSSNSDCSLSEQDVGMVILKLS